MENNIIEMKDFNAEANNEQEPVSMEESNSLEAVRLSSPWMSFYREIAVLFEHDPEVNVEYDEDAYQIKLYVQNGRKADALAKILPQEKVFGNVTVKVVVIPANVEENRASLFADAFAKNPAVVDIVNGFNPALGDVSFLVFAREVVQYFNDDLSDMHGVRTTLYQDIAKDVFADEAGVLFCTALPDGVQVSSEEA